MHPERIILCDIHAPVIDAWRAYFASVPDIAVLHQDIFTVRADALVSPANSFGRMDGGLDEKIVDFLGANMEDAVQDMIRTKHDGELVVGFAEVVPTGHPWFPYLVCAPTMRVPQNVSLTVNPYLAFRATPRAVRDFNALNANPIKTLLVPGLATANGFMPPLRAARQMRAACDHIVFGKRPNLDLSLDAGVDSRDRLEVILEEAAFKP